MEIKRNIKKNWHIYVIVLIMLGAFFVRTWRFSDTLYFKMDQARDASIVRNAFEQGPGMLPLLGPRAAGTFLRLGPIFYYFQYAGALLSGSVQPFVFVFPELLFSILTIPLLYIFLRQFFLRSTSVLTVGLFAFSFIITQYSRFAWNPNQTTFWSILFMLAIYKSVVLKNKKNAGWWLIMAAFGYAILSQLHFSALLAFPLVVLSFWVFYRPKGIKYYFWIGAVFVLMFFYIPMFLSEQSTGWDNLNQFNYALRSKGDSFPITETLEQSTRLHAMQYSLALTSYGNMDDNVFVFLFFAGLAFVFWRANVIYKTKKDISSRAFMVLIACWFFVFALLYTKLAFTVLKPRFWLPSIAIPFVFLAMFFEWLYRPGHKIRGRKIVGFFAMFLFLGNMYAIGYWYWTVANQREGSGYMRQLVLKQDDKVGLGQIRRVVRHMVESSKNEGKKICYYTEGEYRSPYEYVLDMDYPEIEYKRVTFSKDSNENCVFFSIKNGGSNEVILLPKDHQGEFEEIDIFEEGVITIWKMKRVAWLSDEELDEEEEFLNEELEEASEKKDVDSDEEEKRPRRKERVFWRDVFSS